MMSTADRSNYSRRELLVNGSTLAAGLALIPSELAARFVMLSLHAFTSCQWVTIAEAAWRAA